MLLLHAVTASFLDTPDRPEGWYSDENRNRQLSTFYGSGSWRRPSFSNGALPSRKRRDEVDKIRETQKGAINARQLKFIQAPSWAPESETQTLGVHKAHAWNWWWKNRVLLAITCISLDFKTPNVILCVYIYIHIHAYYNYMRIYIYTHTHPKHVQWFVCVHVLYRKRIWWTQLSLQPTDGSVLLFDIGIPRYPTSHG